MSRMDLSIYYLCYLFFILHVSKKSKRLKNSPGLYDVLAKRTTLGYDPVYFHKRALFCPEIRNDPSAVI